MASLDTTSHWRGLEKTSPDDRTGSTWLQHCSSSLADFKSIHSQKNFLPFLYKLRVCSDQTSSQPVRGLLKVPPNPLPAHSNFKSHPWRAERTDWWLDLSWICCQPCWEGEKHFVELFFFIIKKLRFTMVLLDSGVQSSVPKNCS